MYNSQRRLGLGLRRQYEAKRQTRDSEKSILSTGYGIQVTVKTFLIQKGEINLIMHKITLIKL